MLPRGSPTGISPARSAALRALLRVDRGERSETALQAEAPPGGPDRALCWHLVCGSLQQRGALDAVLGQLSHRPLDRLDPSVLAVLRLAVFELRFCRAPARAVIHQAVENARQAGAGQASGFVNALLRSHERARIALSEVQAASHPAWLLARWEQRYGREAALAWARRNNEPAPLALAIPPARAAVRADLEARGFGVEPARAAGAVVPDLFSVRGQTGALLGAEDPLASGCWVQDAAAAAVTDLLDVRPGQRVLDACAAPGGKTFRLCSQGAHVLAVDRSAPRLRQLDESLRALGFEAESRRHDWTDGPLRSEEGIPLFDAVLVDAPCTGLGTLRRHPEIRWRRSEADLTVSAAGQRAILAAAAEHVAPGGALVYAVCSGEPEEGEDIVRSFLVSRADFALEQAWTSAPPQGDEDAFWAARLRSAAALVLEPT